MILDVWVRMEEDVGNFKDSLILVMLFLWEEVQNASAQILDGLDVLTELSLNI